MEKGQPATKSKHESGMEDASKQERGNQGTGELKKDQRSALRALNQEAEKNSKEAAQEVEGELQGALKVDGERKEGVGESNQAVDQQQEEVTEGVQGANSDLIRKQIDGLEVSVDKLKDFYKNFVIGMEWTYIALKNPNSFLIGTSSFKFKVIEDDTEVYCGVLPKYENFICGIIYLPEPFNYYLIASKERIFRKHIDNNRAYPFMNVNCGRRAGACFRYSNLNQRLIINKDQKNIIVANPVTKEIEIELENTVGGKIFDFKLVGEQEDRAVAVTEDGYAILYTLYPNEKSGIVAQYKEELLVEERQEKTISIAVCPKNEYVLIEIDCGLICSRMVILKLSEGTFTKTASLNMYGKTTGSKYALESYDYVGSHILWVGLSVFRPQVYLFDFDTETGEFRELEDKRILHREKYSYKLHRLGNQFYYTGVWGKVYRLSLTV